MNLEELRTVQHKERQKDSLQHLRPTFYREVGEYITDLEAERDRVAADADDPFSSPHVGRLTDEIETAKDVVEAIYERRMGKLVKQASLAAAGMPADDEGLTAEESDLFDDLVARIESNKGRVLETLDGAASAASTNAAEPTSAGDSSDDPRRGERTARAATGATDDAPPVPPEEPAAEGVDGRPPGEEAGVDPDPAADEQIDAADVMGGSPSPTSGPDGVTAPPAHDPADDSADGAATDDGGTESGDSLEPVERLTVRITQDVGAILGVDDREYTLERDDVVTLPQQNAAPLVERDAAEPLE